MTTIEIAVYVAVLSGSGNFICHHDGAAVTHCSNGYVAETLSPDAVRFGDGIVVRHKGEAFPVFSNGMRSWWSSVGWLQFANGIGVRRLPEGGYALSTGLVCRSELPDLADCQHPKAADPHG